jgi:Zn-dependent peptidase ImmA (M78 family)
MRRGFKSEAETRSAEARRALKLAAHAAIDPWKYAAQRNVLVLDIASLSLEPPTLRHLTVVDPSSWSAMTLKDGDQFGIVINPAHVPWRQNNDLMHELAHIDLNHVPSRVDVSPNGLMLLSDYSDEQELEADWLAAALLVPREGLMRLRRQQKNVTEIAAAFGVSNQLCEWRLRMTGVDMQIRRAMNR